MKKYFLVLLLLLPVSLGAQSVSDLRQAYQSNQVEKMISWLQNNQISAQDWQLFTQALFEPDANKAVRDLLAAHQKSTDRVLKSAVRERVSLFYQARGYYETAQNIIENDRYFQRLIDMTENKSVNRQNPIANRVKSGSPRVEGATRNVDTGSDLVRGSKEEASPNLSTPAVSPSVDPKTKGFYGVQLGAYSSFGNAQNLQQSFARRMGNIEVMAKDRNGRKLFLLVASGYQNRAEAELAVQQISQKLGVQGYVIQY